jgi:hypothetical protein
LLCSRPFVAFSSARACSHGIASYARASAAHLVTHISFSVIGAITPVRGQALPERVSDNGNLRQRRMHARSPVNIRPGSRQGSPTRIQAAATHEVLLDRYFDANAQGHDVSNLAEARGIATSVEDRIACGVLYQRADIPDFYARLTPRAGVETTCVEEVRKYDVSQYFGQFL